MQAEYRVKYGSVTLDTGKKDKKTNLPIKTTYSSGQELVLEPDDAKRYGRQIEKLRAVPPEAPPAQATA